jgi:exopolysaccharide biosynthesis protein
MCLENNLVRLKKYNFMFMKKIFFFFIFLLSIIITKAQLHWKLVDSFQTELPQGLQLFYTNDSIDGKPNIAYYIEADLNNPNLIFDVDTTFKRRLTPSEFYKKNNEPLVVVNGTFFSFKTNQNLNTIIKNGKPVSYNVPTTKGSGKDSTAQVKMYRSALGIYGNRKADVAWIQSDTALHLAASQLPINPINENGISPNKLKRTKRKLNRKCKIWNVETAIGGGPVLLQDGNVHITNDEEMLFAGKGKYDKHPRTAMGYTANGKLIILVIQGRFPAKAEGANLLQTATILQQLGCIEALNLDGGGSSCMLVNGKETITPSDKTGQRALPAVFIIRRK